jgi:hypothetical protein
MIIMITEAVLSLAPDVLYTVSRWAMKRISSVLSPGSVPTTFASLVLGTTLIGAMTRTGVFFCIASSRTGISCDPAVRVGNFLYSSVEADTGRAFPLYTVMYDSTFPEEASTTSK